MRALIKSCRAVPHESPVSPRLAASYSASICCSRRATSLPPSEGPDVLAACRWVSLMETAVFVCSGEGFIPILCAPFCSGGNEERSRMFHRLFLKGSVASEKNTTRTLEDRAVKLAGSHQNGPVQGKDGTGREADTAQERLEFSRGYAIMRTERNCFKPMMGARR